MTMHGHVIVGITLTLKNEMKKNGPEGLSKIANDHFSVALAGSKLKNIT